MTKLFLDSGPYAGCTATVHRAAPPTYLSLPLDPGSEWRERAGLSGDGPAYAVYAYDDRDGGYWFRTVTDAVHGHALDRPAIATTYN